MKNKTKQKNNQTKTCLTKQSIKTRLTQNLKAKHTSNAHIKTIREKEKVIESLGALFFPYPGRTFTLIKPLNRR